MNLYIVTMDPAVSRQHYYVVAEDFGDAARKAITADNSNEMPHAVANVKYIGPADEALLP